jgi:hypothetical protein
VRRLQRLVHDGAELMVEAPIARLKEPNNLLGSYS